MIDFETDSRNWTRNISDQRAVEAGCRFNWQRGAFSVWWIERYCKLYEGDGYAGHPVVLWGCKQCDHSDLYATEEPYWEDEECQVPGIGQEIHAERAVRFAECVKAGHDIDWQYDFQMRCYSWEKHRPKFHKFLRRFRKGSVWLAKKQKKSPTMAANSLYVFSGDNEPGQHVYLMAKDGTQAKKIAGEHAFQMLDQSEELSKECKTNMNEMSIYHFDTRSTWEPLSSSNARTQKSKEGLNGSGFVDEAHVVDRAFISRVSRMGISRPEPLFLAFSTAGNDPDGWGYEEFEYATKIIDGRIRNDEYLAIVYAAPQDVTDEELDRDFLRYARMANPSMGHTIDPDEIRADYEQSKETIEKLAEFKMYRLNVWQHSSNPWLRPSDWAKCAAEYAENDLLGKTCFCAFDLSLKWDTTAIILAFPWGEADDGQPRYRLWPYFFLPQETARLTADKVPWREWESKRFIRLTDGNTTDFPLVRRTINEISQKFDLQGNVAYDPKLAAYLAQHLQDEDQIPCEEFRQTPGDFFEPMGRFEADVIAGRIEHPNNAVLNWQAGNATKRKDGMLMKPTQDASGKTEDRNKKIDGIVAAVMAVGRAATAEVSLGWSKDDGVCL